MKEIYALMFHNAMLWMHNESRGVVFDNCLCYTFLWT